MLCRPTDQTDSVPDPGEAELLAKAILLCVDIEGRTQRSGGEQTTGVSGGMDSLLRPLLDTLSRLHTNVYLPLRKTDKSLQLLLRLLQLTPARHTPAAVLQLPPARHTPAAVLQLTPARHTPAAVEKEQGIYCTLLYSNVLYCTLLYYTPQYSTVLFSALLYSTVFCCKLLCSTVLCSTLLYSAVLCCTVLFSTLLCSTVLYSALLDSSSDT